MTLALNQTPNGNPVCPETATSFGSDVGTSAASTKLPLNSTKSPDSKVEISVVLPVYKSAACLEELYQRLTAVVAQIEENYELILIDDGSPDSSWQQIEALSSRDSRVRGIKLSRNFGQHAAIGAGLAACRGNSVVVMDADLQDPPEEIPRLMALAHQGVDIVLARRRSRKFSLWRNVCAAIYFKVLNSLAQSNIDGSCATFSVLSRRVVNAYLTLNDSSHHYLFILFWLGFERQSIEYEHCNRLHGESSYNFSKLVQHALQGIYFQSNKLIESIVWLGLSMIFAGFLLATVLLLYPYFAPNQGWLGLGALMLLISGVNLTALGLVGLYVGQTFEQVKNRPLFIVQQETQPFSAPKGTRPSSCD